MSYIKCLQRAMEYREQVKKESAWLDYPEYVIAYNDELDQVDCLSKPYSDCKELMGVFTFSSKSIMKHCTVESRGKLKLKTLYEAWKEAKKGARP